MMYSITYSIPYIIVSLILCFTVIPIDSRNSYKHIRYMVAFTVLSAFVCLHGYLFTDWINYRLFFDDAPIITDSNLLLYIINSRYKDNFLFLFGMICLKSIWNNYFFFQAIWAFVDLLVLLHIYRKLITRKNYPLFFLFFFVFQGMQIFVNEMRNVKAMMLFLLSVPYISQRKFLPFLLLNICGSFFHTSAILYILTYFFCGRNFSTRFLYLAFFLGLTIFFGRIRWLTNLLLVLSNSSSFPILKLAYHYASQELTTTSLGISVGMLERIFSFFLVVHFREKLIGTDKKNIVYCNLFFLYVLIYFYGNEMSIVTARVSTLFIVAYWFVYPQIYALLRRKIKMLFLCILAIYCCVKCAANFNQIISHYTFALVTEQNYIERKSFTDKYLIQSVRRLLNGK